MKITKQQLTEIKSRAVQNVVELSPAGLTHEQFVGKCWLEACAAVLKIETEYEQRPIPEPAEE